MVSDLQIKAKPKFTGPYTQIHSAGQPRVPQLSRELGKPASEWKYLSKTSTSNWKLMLFVSLPPACPALNTKLISAAQAFLPLPLPWLCKPATGLHSKTLISILVRSVNGRIYCCRANINLRN